MKIITFGSFDVLHYGHVRLLQRAKALGGSLTVGVSSDALNIKKKGRQPVYSEFERMALVKALRCVDHVFLEESLEEKRNYILQYSADVLVMGNDWEGRFDEYKKYCQVVYLDRTPSISTTSIIETFRRK